MPRRHFEQERKSVKMTNLLAPLLPHKYQFHHDETKGEEGHPGHKRLLKKVVCGLSISLTTSIDALIRPPHKADTRVFRPVVSAGIPW
jgi:hypothetical protein